MYDGAGNERMYADGCMDPGEDVLYGGPGRDHMYGVGNCIVNGVEYGYDDLLYSYGDGERDFVDCGPGVDVVFFDEGLDQTTRCEVRISLLASYVRLGWVSPGIGPLTCPYSPECVEE